MTATQAVKITKEAINSNTTEIEKIEKAMKSKPIRDSGLHQRKLNELKNEQEYFHFVLDILTAKQKPAKEKQQPIT